jgi:hypothetical protein
MYAVFMLKMLDKNFSIKMAPTLHKSQIVVQKLFHQQVKKMTRGGVILTMDML